MQSRLIFCFTFCPFFLFGYCFCFLLFSSMFRTGEGWGRPIVEAMAMSLPTIATDWSGITQYLNHTNGYPLPIDGLSPIPSGPFQGEHQWANPSLSELRRLMREVKTNQGGDAVKRGQAARRTMVKEYSPEKLAQDVMNRLHAIEGLIQSN
jgi:glycosyltransferase involved in cell wall biosynthesis